MKEIVCFLLVALLPYTTNQRTSDSFNLIQAQMINNCKNCAQASSSIFNDIALYFGHIIKAIQILLTILLVADIVVRMSGNPIAGARGIIHVYRFMVYTFALSAFWMIDTAGSLRGFGGYFFSHLFDGSHNSYFGIGFFSIVSNDNSKTYPNVNFINSSLIEMILYVLTAAVGLITLGMAMKGSKVGALCSGIRLALFFSFGFLFVGHAWFSIISVNRSLLDTDLLDWISVILSILFLLYVFFEIIFLIINAALNIEPEFTEAEVVKPCTLFHIYRHANMAFCEATPYEQSLPGRLLNSLWLMRWFVVCLIAALVSKSPRTALFILSIIQIIWVGITGWLTFGTKVVSGAVAGVMIVEELSIAIAYLIAFYFSIDGAKGGSASSGIIWILSIILFFSFWISFICEIILLALGFVASKNHKEALGGQNNDVELGNFDLSEEDLAMKVERYKATKDHKPTFGDGNHIQKYPANQISKPSNSQESVSKKDEEKGPIVKKNGPSKL